MATKSAARRTKDQVVDVTETGAAGAAAAAQDAADQASGEVRGEVRGKLLREAPYAARGLGRTVAEASREVDADALPERLRRTPGAAASKVSRLGTDARSTYVALVARGRGEQVRDAGESAATADSDTASAGLRGSEEAPDGTGARVKEFGGKVIGSVKHASEVAGTKATEVAGRVKRIATRSSSDGDEAARTEAASRAEAETEKLDVGTGPFEKRTVAQLRNRASELGIEGRTTMKKAELIRAIRDAT